MNLEISNHINVYCNIACLSSLLECEDLFLQFLRQLQKAFLH